jgi:hypothetical protein
MTMSRKNAPAKGATGANSEAPFEASWLDASPDRARAFVDEAGPRAADLVAAWIANKNAAAVAAVAADDSAPAPARKAARRGINVLKSRGIAIPSAPRVMRVAEDAAPVYEAWFRPPDAGGSSAFTVGTRSAEGRYKLVDVILQRGKGVVSVAGMEMSRTQLRTTFDGIAERFGHPPAPVPVAWARARIAAAHAENARTGAIVPLGFDTHADLLGAAPHDPPSHPADSLAAAVDAEEALARSAKLHGEPELRAWLPEPQAMQAMLIALQTQIVPAAGDDKAATETMVASIIADASDRYFTAEVRNTVADALKDAAISIAARGANDRASDALAVAEAVRSPAPAPRDVPFLRAFFEKAFGLAAARAAGIR